MQPSSWMKAATPQLGQRSVGTRGASALPLLLLAALSGLG